MLPDQCPIPRLQTGRSGSIKVYPHLRDGVGREPNFADLLAVQGFLQDYLGSQLGLILGVGLSQDVDYVYSYGDGSKVKHFGDLLVGKTLCNEDRNLLLPKGQWEGERPLLVLLIDFPLLTWLRRGPVFLCPAPLSLFADGRSRH